ncbi:polyamine aminopropyltransferase [Ectothiorhodospiraceae bacterium 2226]|nr:polyamine aminopropyltransferase [Ectothiorhodospiraceae bacterium 2226]
MALDSGWFTEINTSNGFAMSLKVKAKLHEEQSEYQRIEVYETETFGRLMTIDGLVMLTDRDNFIYHEMMSHPALFAHPHPRNVLIIGGGDCGTLREVLKHPDVQRVQQVEIDERVTRVSEQFFPELCESNDDPRAELHFVDGIKWVKDAEDGFYDVIIVDSTDPVGPAKGLFSRDFYRDCRRALGTNGIIVGQSESPLFHLDLLKEMHGEMRAAEFLDILTLNFPQCTYPSGWWSCTMACKDMPLSGFREEAVVERPFKTRYYNHGIHSAAMTAPTFLFDALL